jgi:hydroxyquinol 1,2-dioxygenase
MDFGEEALLDAVLTSFAGTPDPRLKAILGTVTRHLHAAVRELRLTNQEWDQAIEFLTAAGHKTDDTRQEFVLLSDVLGVSMLVETINGGDLGTESTVLGPFHMVESPVRQLGDSIDLVGTGTPCVITGSVADLDGSPLGGATIDVWQCDENGFYDVRTVVPSHYPIPTDGPVGELLGATGRHPYRPAHVHVIAEATGYEPLTTHMFVADGPYVDSDAVFAVRSSLVTDFAEVTDPAEAEGYGVTAPFRRARFDIRLTRAVP